MRNPDPRGGRKQNLPQDLIREIDLFSFLYLFPHLTNPQARNVKEIDSPDLRLSHSSLTFAEYYKYLKNYYTIADVELQLPRKRRIAKDEPLTLTIYDKVRRRTYSQDELDASELRGLIREGYTIAKSSVVEKLLGAIEDGKYAKDTKLSLKQDEKFQRRRYRHLYLHSTGDENDLKKCMLAFKLSEKDIQTALKHRVYVRETGSGEAPEKAGKLGNRLILKRFDVYFSLSNLIRVVYKKT